MSNPIKTLTGIIGASLLAAACISIALVRNNHSDLHEKKKALRIEFLDTCRQLQAVDKEEDTCSHTVEDDDPRFPHCLELEHEEFALRAKLPEIVRRRNDIGDELGFVQGFIVRFPNGPWYCNGT